MHIIQKLSQLCTLDRSFRAKIFLIELGIIFESTFSSISKVNIHGI